MKRESHAHKKTLDQYFAILLAILCATFLLFSLMGCGIASVPGDTYSTTVHNEGGPPTWARTVESEKWCEWFYPDFQTAKIPWAVIAFDLSDWNRWVKGGVIGEGRRIEIDPKAGTISIDGVQHKFPAEPRVKWVRYDIGAAWRHVR